MSRFLFTMLPANDLGLPTRMVPIARALADRGHEVAVFNPSPAPARLITDAGLANLPLPARPMPAPVFDLMRVEYSVGRGAFLRCLLHTGGVCSRNVGSVC